MITGESLRIAREARGWTQRDVARVVGVSLRTVGNWERGQAIPAKYWEQLEARLPAVHGIEERVSLSEAIGQSARRLRGRLAHESGQAERAVDLILAARRSIDLADAATDLGAHPGMVIDLVEAVTNIVLETGVVSLPLPDGESVNQTIILRGADVAKKAVESYEPIGPRPYLLTLGTAREKLEEKESAWYHGDDPRNVPDPEETQESYGLVANDSINEFPPGDDAEFDQA